MYRLLAVIPFITLVFVIPYINREEPYIFGLPFLLFWIAVWVLISSIIMWFIYWLEYKK